MNKWYYFTITGLFVGAYHFFWWMLISPQNPRPLFLELAAWYPLPFWGSIGILTPFVLYGFLYWIFQNGLQIIPIGEIQYPQRSWLAVISQGLFVLCILYQFITVTPRIANFFLELYHQSIDLALWTGLELAFLLTQFVAWYLILNSLVVIFAIQEKTKAIQPSS